MTTYIISDLHLKHKNIIQYCQRPFHSIDEMDYTIIHNWNSIVQPDDTVYFLGDLSLHFDESLALLNGNIIFIKGNHDKSKMVEFYDSLILELVNQKVLLIHNPADIPKNWQSWVIHGHSHNNELEQYPKINYKNKTINVCVELWDYKPIPLQTIINIIQK